MKNEMPGRWQGQLDRHDLEQTQLPANPLTLFEQWLAQAQATDMLEPTAMTLATVDANGTPSARMVLLKGFDEQGFRFYTNYYSRKAQALASHAYAALVFWWPPLERQVRITGPVAKISAALSDTYFSRRSRGSQIGAHASQQSQVIASREALADRQQQVAEQFGDAPIKRPEHWGGFQVKAQTIEFWQARLNRLHDRIEYIKTPTGWASQRLAP